MSHGREIMDIVSISEGDCPDCGNNIEIINIGGIHEWVYGEQFLMCPFNLHGAKTITVWEKPIDEFSSIGSVEAKCIGCGKTFYTEQTQSGDWTS